MSEQHQQAPAAADEPKAASRPEPPAAAAAPIAAPPARHRGGRRAPLAWLAGLLVLVIAGVLASPLWAPAVAPMLPWAAPAPHVDLHPLEARLAALEQRPAPPKVDLSGVEAGLKSLAARVDRLDRAAAGLAELRGGVQRLEQQLAAQTKTTAADLGRLQQQDAQAGKLAAALSDRVAAIEGQLRAAGGADRKGAALLVLLLQMRAAVEAGRPFAANYDAFATLAAGQRELLAAAKPLADAAPKGVASRAALAAQLHQTAGRIASATAPPDPSDWKAEALARIRALVRVRHIGAAAQSGPDAAVANAEAALDRGDLTRAVGELAGLSGAPAEAAAAWLQQARARLAVETALARVQQMLAAQLAPAPGKPAPPS